MFSALLNAVVLATTLACQQGERRESPGEVAAALPARPTPIPTPDADVRAAQVELAEDRAESRLRDGLAALDGVLSVHEHLGLDNGNEAPFLAQRRVSGEGVGVASRQAGVGRPGPMVMTARHLANRAPRSRYSARRSRSPSSPSVMSSPEVPARGVVPLSTLMPGRIPCPDKTCPSGVPSSAA